MNIQPSTMTLEDARKLIGRIKEMTYEERRDLADAFLDDVFRTNEDLLAHPEARNWLKFTIVTPSGGEAKDKLYIMLRPTESGEWIAKEAILDESVESIKQLRTRPVKSVIYPLDKLNDTLWSLKESGDVIKGLTMNSRNKEAILIFKTLWEKKDDIFDRKEGNGISAHIPQRLDMFDKHVYIAAAALFYAGNASAITLTHIWHAMGNPGKPNGTQLERLNDSLSKMTVRIQIDNSKEVEINKHRKPFAYDGDLLSFERVTERVRIDGAIVDAYIRILAEPPLIRLARQYGQFTTLQLRMLAKPLNQTEATLSLEDYLITRISRAKNGHGHKKMCYETIFQNCGINVRDERDRKRAIEKITKFLDQYVREEFILGYSLLKDGIRVSVKQPVEKPKKKQKENTEKSCKKG